jgi:hypothetical protein
MQEWRLGAFKILCYGAKMYGEVTELQSETYTTTIKFRGCGWYPEKNSLHVAAVWGKTGLTIVYDGQGWIEAVGNGSNEFVEFRKARILETAAYIKISATKLCTIIIPEQILPARAVKKPEDQYSAATFTNELFANPNLKLFPNGQERIVIGHEFRKVLYKYGGAGTQCATAPEFEKTAEEGGGAADGRFKGTLETWIPKGNLRFE